MQEGRRDIASIRSDLYSFLSLLSTIIVCLLVAGLSSRLENLDAMRARRQDAMIKRFDRIDMTLKCLHNEIRLLLPNTVTPTATSPMPVNCSPVLFNDPGLPKYILPDDMPVHMDPLVNPEFDHRMQGPRMEDA